MTVKAPETLLRVLRDGSRFLITSHLNPDGDAVGSSLGLARLLRLSGKSATVWFHDPLPGSFQGLPGADRAHSGSEAPSGGLEGFDAVFILECPQLERTGLAEALEHLPLINIDHHLGNTQYGKVNWVDSRAPAVGALVLELAEAERLPMDETVANLLLLALTSDTGGFSFANTTAEAHEAAAALVRAGAQPEEVTRWVQQNRSPAALRLIAAVIPTVELAAQDARIATAVVTLDMLAASGATPADGEGLVDLPRSLAGVEAVALLRELAAGEWKVSLRSRGDLDVQRIALRHEGGGHRNAAGCRWNGALATARQEVVTELVEALPA